MYEHGNHPVSTAGGTWYLQACKFLNLYHYIHSFEKSKIERMMQYIKDMIECFYFPCNKNKYEIPQVKR